MSLDFPSKQWVAALVSECNASSDFKVASAEWTGAVACEVTDCPQLAGGSFFFRLEGEEGHWTTFDQGSDPSLAAGTRFALHATQTVWQEVIRQEVHPIKGVIQGRLRVTGQLSAALRWSAALTVVVRLAGKLDTSFTNEA